MNNEQCYQDEIYHYGMPRRSGRYPYGSGKEPYQHSGGFIARVEELRKSNFNMEDEHGKKLTGDMAISKALGFKSKKEFDMQLSIAKAEQRSMRVKQASDLRSKGYSLQKIADEMGLNNDSSVRALLNEGTKARKEVYLAVADEMEKAVKGKNMIEIGKGVENQIGVSRDAMDKAVAYLKTQGYENYKVRIKQVTGYGDTTLDVLCPPGTEYKSVYDNMDKIKPLRPDKEAGQDVPDDEKFVYPKSMDSKRLAVRYAEDGGEERDGTIEIRRGVKDLDLGTSNYAQVRILVDDTHYIKGMAIYSDDIPEGKDIVFNTNKKKGTPVCGTKENTVLKKITDDPDNPFGSLIKKKGQSYYQDDSGHKQLSLINKRAEEGDWDEWAKNLPSQFASKQNIDLAKKQLNLALADKKAYFEDIKNLNNNAVKQHFLDKFADGCDSAAVELKAAALPGQRYQVILPIPSLKDTECYAPNYASGQKLALVRYPHGGPFEIPIVTVNNKNKEAVNKLGKNPKDVVGINSSVAGRLSGADFDGDTVMAIPISDKVKITSAPPLKGLEGFDPKKEYPEKPGMKYMTKSATQKEMGVISNLITDMTLKGATDEEKARAVRHSMVVIDAYKHRLDYKQSEIDNNIQSLKNRYQAHINPETGRVAYGASTIISRASSDARVAKTKGSRHINPDGTVWYKTQEPYLDRATGKMKQPLMKISKMEATNDARSLISEQNLDMEKLYANYANSMKAMANEARKEMIATPNIVRKPESAKLYAKQVASLELKLNQVKLNAPKERQAQILANANINEKKRQDPTLESDKAMLKKVKQQELNKARVITGAKGVHIEVTDDEWEAIQAGAISHTKLQAILEKADQDKLRERSMPKEKRALSDVKINRLQALQSSGYTNEQIAKALDVSVSTVLQYLK